MPVDVDRPTTYLYCPITKIDEDQRMVYGYASGPEVDRDGQEVDPTWLRQAFQDWFDHYGNIRWMHQPIPVGKATVLEWHGDKPWLGAYIEDDKTWNQIKLRILNGFSIGIKNPKVAPSSTAPRGRFVGGEVIETSAVDVPSYRGGDFAYYKGAQETELDVSIATMTTEDDRSRLKVQADARAQRYGIGFKEGKGHLTPPDGYPTAEADYGDPVNYAYPIDASRITAAVSYFNHDGQREAGGYSEEEWATIGRRIAAAAGQGHEYQNGEIVDKEDTNVGKTATATKTTMSDDAKRDAIRAAAGDHYYVQEVFSDEGYAVLGGCYDSGLDGKYFKVPFTIQEDGQAVLGAKEEAQRTYSAVEKAAAMKAAGLVPDEQKAAMTTEERAAKVVQLKEVHAGAAYKTAIDACKDAGMDDGDAEMVAQLHKGHVEKAIDTADGDADDVEKVAKAAQGQAEEAVKLHASTFKKGAKKTVEIDPVAQAADAGKAAGAPVGVTPTETIDASNATMLSEVQAIMQKYGKDHKDLVVLLGDKGTAERAPGFDPNSAGPGKVPATLDPNATKTTTPDPSVGGFTFANDPAFKQAVADEVARQLSASGEYVTKTTLPDLAKAAVPDVSKALEDIQLRLATVENMAAPGGPVQSDDGKGAMPVDLSFLQPGSGVSPSEAVAKLAAIQSAGSVHDQQRATAEVIKATATPILQAAQVSLTQP